MLHRHQRGLFENWSEFDRLFDDMETVLRGRHRRLGSGTSVKTDKDSATIVIEVPGYDASDLDVQVEDNVVTVSVNREEDEAVTGKVHVDEFRHVTGNPSYRLPFKVDPKQVKAVCKDGLLTLTLERATADKPKKIKVIAA